MEFLISEVNAMFEKSFIGKQVKLGCVQMLSSSRWWRG